MKILSTNEVICILTDSKLQILDILTLKEKYINRSLIPKCFALLNLDFLLFGQSDGTLCQLCLKSFEKKMIYKQNTKNNTSMTSLFVLDNFIYSGYNDGTILKLKYTNSQVNIFKKYSHNLPILDITSDGEQILASDLSGKVTSYPSKIVYDLVNPLFLFKFYVFIAEKNVLYCLTNNSINSYIQTNTSIKKISFSRNGGVVFIMLYDSILVFNFNTKQVIKEINKCFVDFVYDEKRDRIIGLFEKGKEIVKDILNDLYYDEMDRVVFRDNKIREKVVKITEDEEYNYKCNDEDYYEDEYYEDDESEEYVKNKKSKNLKNLFDEDDESEDYVKNKKSKSLKNLFDEDKQTIKHRKTVICDESDEIEINKEILQVSLFPIIVSQEKLLFYNDIGYLISIKGPDFSRVELRFHDKSRDIVEIVDYNDCCIGSFYNTDIVLCNNTTLYFYGVTNWTKELNNETVTISINSKYVVVSNGVTIIYDYNGEEIFNCYINNVTYILATSKYIFVFSNILHVIDLHINTKILNLPKKVSWAYFYNNRLYYKIDKDIYLLYKKLSYRICQNVSYPLAIVGNNLVCLDNTMKILPSPNIHYIALPYKISNFFSIEESSKDSKKENYKNCQEDSLSDEESLFN